MISPLSRLPGSTLARELIRVSVALLLQDRVQETMRFPYASPCAPFSPLLDSRPLVEAGHTISLQPNRSAQDGACIAPGRPVSREGLEYGGGYASEKTPGVFGPVAGEVCDHQALTGLHRPGSRGVGPYSRQGDGENRHGQAGRAAGHGRAPRLLPRQFCALEKRRGGQPGRLCPRSSGG